MLSTEPVKSPNPAQREPIVAIGAIVAVLQYLLSEWAGLSALLISLGVNPAWVETGQTIIVVLLTVLGIFIGRAFVTPLASPKNADGEKLTVA